MKFYHFLGPFLIACAPVGVSAQSSSDDLFAARLLVEQGRFSQAIQLSHQIEDVFPLDAALIQVRSYLARGKVELALKAGMRAVSLDPNRFDAHFLLASVLEASGNPRNAKLRYRLAYDASVSDIEKTLAASAIRRLDLGKDWRFSYNLGIAPSSNVEKATANATVNLITGPATIASDGPVAGSGLNYSFTLRQFDPDGLVLSTSGFLYEDPSQSNLNVRLGFGLDLFEDFPTDFAVEQKYIGPDLYRNRASVRANLDSGLSSEMGLSTGVAWTAYVDGSSVTEVSATLIRDLFASERASVFGQFDFARHSSDSAEYAAEMVGVTISSNVKFPSFAVRGSVGVAAWDWDEAYWLYPTPRQDRSVTISGQIAASKVSFYGMQPIFKGSWQKRQSNIATYDLESFDLFTGFVSSF